MVLRLESARRQWIISRKCFSAGWASLIIQRQKRMWTVSTSIERSPADRLLFNSGCATQIKMTAKKSFLADESQREIVEDEKKKEKSSGFWLLKTFKTDFRKWDCDNKTTTIKSTPGLPAGNFSVAIVASGFPITPSSTKEKETSRNRKSIQHVRLRIMCSHSSRSLETLLGRLLSISPQPFISSIN